MPTIQVRVTAHARRNSVEWRNGLLHVSVTAPADNGKANDAVLRLVAREFGVAPTRLSIARGTRTRTKLIEINGILDEELRRAMEAGAG